MQKSSLVSECVSRSLALIVECARKLDVQKPAEGAGQISVEERIDHDERNVCKKLDSNMAPSVFR